MSGNNTYSGTTTINGTLTVNSLTNFGAASGLGDKASNLSSNLVIDGGTLRVQVSAGTSDRLFTVGAGGATLEAMLTGGNSGQINFTGATAITYTGVGNRTLTIGGTSDDAGGSSIARVIGDVGGGNGTVALAKTGVQDWTVSGTNTYTGGTTVSGAGTLTMGSSSALGSTSGQLTVNAGTLNMVANNLTVGNLTGTGGTISGTSGARTLTIGQGDFGGGDYQGAIANGAGGTTALTKTGTGTITLSGTNSYTGATAVNAGTLRVNGTHTGGGTYTLASGATLGGSGTTASALDVSGIIAPGNSIGTLNTGAVTWNGAASAGSGTDWVFELGASNTADLLNITGNFSKVTGVGSVFRFDFAASTATGTFDLATWSGSTGFAAPDFSYTNLGGANTGSFQISGSTLQFVAVPEPASLAILAGGGLMALGVLRRKLRR
jgi:autotransporter-associated beta strand protein